MSFSTNQPNRRSSPARTRAREEGTAGGRERTSEHWVDANGTETAATAIDALDGPPDRYRLLVPVVGGTAASDVERLARTAATIAGERGGELLLVGLVLVPEQAALDQMSTSHPRYTEALDATARARLVADETNVPARSVICKSHRKASAILGMIEKYDADGVSMAIRPDSSQRRRLLAGSVVEKIAARAACDVFVGKPGTGTRTETDPPKRLLLAVAGGPHSGLAVETARLLALGGTTRVDIVHFVDDERSASKSEHPSEQATEILRAADGALADVSRVESELVTLPRTTTVAAALVERSAAYDVTVLGAPTRGLLTQFVFGTVPDSVKRRTEGRVVMTKRNTGKTSVYDRWIAGDGIEITDGIGTTGASPPPSRADETAPEEAE